jgi:hypothetical protein
MGRLGEYSLVLLGQLLFLLLKVRCGKLFLFKQSTDLPPEHVTRRPENIFRRKDFICIERRRAQRKKGATMT